MIPTLGASAVVMALQLCDQVSLAGFGYDMQHPETRLHYYETLRMGAMKAQVREQPKQMARVRLHAFILVTVVSCSRLPGGARHQR